ncbi:MAG: YeeE/YedE family protein [Candidatus Promineifilaceae bacterium]
MTIFLAIFAGIGLGYILERGDFCFHSTMRGLFRQPAELDLFRAYLLTLLIAVPLVSLMRWIGWIDPWVAPFSPGANMVGGIIFGVGMVIAATCITGLFYKLGHGMLGTMIALITWAVGDVLAYRGPLSSLRDTLNANPLTRSGEQIALPTLLGSAAPFLLALVGAAIAFYLWQSPRGDRQKYWGWLPLGIATGLFTSGAWLLARNGGSNYPYGTSSVPTQIFDAITTDSTLSVWIPLSLVTIVFGALLASYLSGTLWVRGETIDRYAELATGGLLMGIGAGIAGGCNLGHSLIGVPLLSLGSIATTFSMALGVFVAHQAKQMWAARYFE